MQVEDVLCNLIHFTCEYCSYRLDSVTLGNPGDSREDASEERQSNLGATFQGNHGKDEAQADQPVVINTGDEELIVQNPTQQA